MHNLMQDCDRDEDMLTPRGYPSTPTQQPAWPTAHSQHCGHTALPPGQKTNPRGRADPTQTVYAHPFRRAQTQARRKGVAKRRRPRHIGGVLLPRPRVHHTIHSHLRRCEAAHPS